MSLSLVLSGVEEAMAKLRAMAGQVNDTALREDTKAALELVAETARSLAPVDSGLLRASIGIADSVVFDSSTDGRTTYVGVLMAGVGGNRAGYKDAYYAHMVEFGTEKMAAQPFLTPAWDAHEAEVIDILGKRLARRLERSL